MIGSRNSRGISRIVRGMIVPLSMVALMWVVQIFQSLTMLELGYYGIRPRSQEGFQGVFLAPLIHSGYSHLLSNTFPFLALSGLMVVFYTKIAVRAIWIIYFLTGIFVWFFGRTVYHIGASGVVYGLLAFVFWTGIFRRNIKSIALAVLVLFYYGSMFSGILPGQEDVSWESHLLGAVAGIIVAFLYKGSRERDEVLPPPVEEEAPTYYFDRDIFDEPK